MHELLRKIRGGIIEPYLKHLSVNEAELKMGGNPWYAVQEVLNPPPQEGESKQEQKGSSTEPNFWKLAATHLVNHLAEAETQHKLVALRQRLEKQLEESHIACALFTSSSGNASLPWDRVDETFQSESTSKSVRIGTLNLTAASLGVTSPAATWSLSLPAMLPFDDGRAVFVAGTETMREKAITGLSSAALRLLQTSPPGTTEVFVFDLKGLGVGRQSPWDHLPGSVCADSQQIERHVDEILTHMNRISVERLGNTFANLQAFNASARSRNSACEPYYVIVMQDCHAALSRNLLHKIQTIAQNGARCGVFALIHWGDSCEEQALDELREVASGSALVLPASDGAFAWQDENISEYRLDLDVLPPAQTTTRILSQIARAHEEKNASILTYGELVQLVDRDELWQESSIDGLRTPLGCSPTGKPVWLEIGGTGLKQNALIVGAPGSGKTNIMHVSIMGLAERYSPEELQFYLIDFKGGVGFKVYAVEKLPHAAVIAIDCDREFGLSTLEGLVAEMDQRMELFRSVTADDITMYRRQTGKPLPRKLLFADEFQELFIEDDLIAQRSRTALDALLRKGRAFGLHLFLGTQTFKGPSSRSISLELIAIRLAMRCSTEDSQAILSYNNLAGQTLSDRPGDCIYNADFGQLQANLRCMAAFMDATARTQRLKIIASMQHQERAAIVFEGNEPISFEQSQNWKTLNILLRDDSAHTIVPGVWLGEPVAIQPAPEVVFTKQRNRHLLVMMQKPLEGLAPLFNALLILLLRYKAKGAHCSIVNVLNDDSPWHDWPDKIRNMFVDTHGLDCVSQNQVPGFFSALAEEVKQRVNSPTPLQPHFVFVLGLQFARDIRPGDAYSSQEPDLSTTNGAFRYIVKEGAEHHVHILAWCDLLANIKRIGRGVLEEFGVRFVGPMTQSDSSDCIGTLEAARLHKNYRAILYDEASPEGVKTLRSYSLPSLECFEKVITGKRSGV